MSVPLRIAMWSGPRNLSTAMMRAWENRGDTAVWDEPLYAHYLHATGIDHPDRTRVIAAGEVDWRRVVARLSGDVPDGRAVFFQKHMAHHLLPGIDRTWLGAVTNCFLIRDPREVVASYARTRPDPTAADIGAAELERIYDLVAAQSDVPPLVVDARDLLADPRGILRALCVGLGVAFTERMLSWPPGPRETDGVWAPHWYRSVWESTGFQPVAPKTGPLPRPLETLARRCEPHYRRLWERRLRAEATSSPGNTG